MPSPISRSPLAYYRPALVVGGTVMVIATITRLLLLIKTGQHADLHFLPVIALFCIGFVFDALIASYFMLPLVLHLWWMNERMYAPRWRWISGALFAGVIAVLLFTSLVPADFNRQLREAVIGYFMLRFAIFIFLSLCKPEARAGWRRGVLLTDYFLLCFLLLFIAISEWFFWDEFSARFNFIAVDYLVYTNEVLGNIRESYPIGTIILSLAAVAAIATWMNRRRLTKSAVVRPPFAARTGTAAGFFVVPVFGFLFLNSNLHKFSRNEYVNELAGNGVFEFGTAFLHNELDYYKFYRTMPDSSAFRILRDQLAAPNARFSSPELFNIERAIHDTASEKHMNVVLISVESLSADFMGVFGNQEHLTPCLDSIAQQGMLFTRLYASGTRTVRGLEALSLGITPTPGQSIVKRPHNENMFSLGSVFRSKGYEAEYIYGGYGYFDNMNYFFSHNGYRVVDREALSPRDIHYANIWGVADEDLFTLATRELDSLHAGGKNFFAHVMTVSNHRPFTYPEGRIDIPPSRQSRSGAVKYTDYAIGRFIREARSKPWFSNTLFVIVADHCAGSAGSAELPVTGYHIPLIIYSPGNIAPRRVDELTAQIDIPPTLLGILHFSYRSKFFGRDVFVPEHRRPKAFISTYQGLGYLTDDRLVIGSPVKKIREWQPDFTTGKAQEVPLTDSLVQQAIAFYQCASWLVNHNKYGK